MILRYLILMVIAADAMLLSRAALTQIPVEQQQAKMLIADKSRTNMA